MKAIGVKEAGLPDMLKVVDLPQPQPKINEIVVKQNFAGVNYGDAIRRKRGLFKLNEHGYFVPGFEGVGKIILVGNAVQNFKIGDRVGYLSEEGGGYSQEICLNERFVFHVPEEVIDETAAVISCVGTTAWYLVKLANIKMNDWVIIHGAAGGVGLLLVQLCLLKGAKVIAIVGTQKKKEFLQRYDIIETIVRNEHDIVSQINSVTNGENINIIFDCVGQAVLEMNLSSIGKGGTILYYGSTSGHPSFPGMNILMNSIKVQGFNIFNLLQDTTTWRQSLKELITILVEKKLDIYIERIFRIDQASEAHQLLENRQSIGKFLIDLR